MDKELSFNNKISNWMSNQQFLFQADSIQENLLLLKRRIADTELSDIDKDLIEKIAEETLILSKARPMSKKNEMYDAEDNLFSMDLEFNIKQNER